MGATVYAVTGMVLTIKTLHLNLQNKRETEAGHTDGQAGRGSRLLALAHRVLHMRYKVGVCMY